MKDIVFQLGTPDANTFVRFARAFIDQKDTRRPVCTMAHGKIYNGVLYVRGTDWVRAFELALPLLSASAALGFRRARGVSLKPARGSLRQALRLCGGDCGSGCHDLPELKRQHYALSRERQLPES